MADADRILSQNEIDALLSAIDSGAAVAGVDDAATPYDFRHPSRLGREPLQALEKLHDDFARSLQGALGGLLRAPADVRVAGVHPLPLAEGLRALPSPTVLSVLSCEPLEGFVLLDLSPTIAVPAIERLLGSAKAGPPGDPRPLTTLEWGVFETLLGAVLDLLSAAWAPLEKVAFRLLRRESDPGSLRLPRTEESGVRIVLEAEVGGQRGTLTLLFPVRTVESRLPKLLALPAPAARAEPPGEGGSPALPDRLSPAEVTLGAHLPPERVSMGEIRSLRPGDLLVSGHAATAPVLLAVEGCPKFQARLGRLKERRAVRIEREGGSEETGRRARIVRTPGAEEGATSAPEAILSLPLQASVVLAEKRTLLREVLALRPGDLLTFDRRADAPLELRIGGRRIAEGVAVRLGERFGLRVSAAADPRERARALGT